jgi:hypothetical protein
MLGKNVYIYLVRASPRFSIAKFIEVVNGKAALMFFARFPCLRKNPSWGISSVRMEEVDQTDHCDERDKGPITQGIPDHVPGHGGGVESPVYRGFFGPPGDPADGRSDDDSEQSVGQCVTGACNNVLPSMKPAGAPKDAMTERLVRSSLSRVISAASAESGSCTRLSRVSIRV